MTHLTEEDLILHYYGEAAADSHLAGCPECREALRVLQRDLALVDAVPAPEAPLGYESRTWARLQDKMRPTRWRWLSRWPRPAAALAAMAALLIAAFTAGRYSHRVVPDPSAAQAPVRERVLLVAVGDHLERSQMVLVEMQNARRGEDFGVEREMAQDLLGANRLFRQTAMEAGDRPTADLLEELERVLLDVAHSPERMSGAELDALRRRMKEQGILFKIRVAGTRSTL